MPTRRPSTWSEGVPDLPPAVAHPMPEEQPVIRTAFETFISLPFYYGQRDPARSPRVVEDGLACYLGAGGVERALAGIEVALPAGMGAGCDLHPHPMIG